MRFSLALAALALASTPALADDPTGDWLVADGNAMIRIENCGSAVWGFVYWEKTPGGLDSQNPDPTKRDRPTLGLPILRNMQNSAKNPARWDGEVYNAQNGKTYTAHIALSDPNTLRIEGCVLGFLCGGQDWTRGTALDPSMGPTATSVMAAQGKPPATAKASMGPATTSSKTTTPKSAATKPAAGSGAAQAHKPATTAAAAMPETEDSLCSTLTELPGPAH